jgi:hypothetical protein
VVLSYQLILSGVNRTYLIKKGRDYFQHLVLLDRVESGFNVHLDKIQLWAGSSAPLLTG